MATGDLRRWFELRDRASSADRTTCTWKIRSAAALCPAYVAASAAGHHGCPRACQAPIWKACSRHTATSGIAW